MNKHIIILQIYVLYNSQFFQHYLDKGTFENFYYNLCFSYIIKICINYSYYNIIIFIIKLTRLWHIYNYALLFSSEIRIYIR